MDERLEVKEAKQVGSHASPLELIGLLVRYAPAAYPHNLIVLAHTRILWFNPETFVWSEWNPSPTEDVLAEFGTMIFYKSGVES